MRIKAIMVGAIAGLALATLTANAGSTATPRVSGSLVSLLAATTTVTKVADREAATVATRSAEDERAAEPAAKPVVAVKPVTPRALQTTAACQQAIDTLKAMLTNCVRLGPETQNRGGHANFRAHLEGKVGFVESVNPARGARLRAILEAIRW